MLHQLRQRRYLMLGALMLVVASVCALAGTWQVERLREKRAVNHLLRSNAAQPARAVGEVLARVGVVGAGRRAENARFRSVTATGTYDSPAQQLVRGRTVDGVVGFLVLTPLRPDAGGGATLLVVRGFVAADNGRPPAIATPPSTPVRLVGRVQAPERDDGSGREPPGQVKAIDPAAAASRLGTAVWDGYVELPSGQPGIAGMTPVPAPDLSNPAGGAATPQHLAYIVQWYVFALLALAVPFLLARADSGRDPADGSDDFADVSDPADFDHPLSSVPIDDPAETARRAKLADRYGSVRRT